MDNKVIHLPAKETNVELLTRLACTSAASLAMAAYKDKAAKS